MSKQSNTNRELGLEDIMNEMYTHKVEQPADNTVDETGCNTNREDADASAEDMIKCPHCDKLIQASGCGSH